MKYQLDSNGRKRVTLIAGDGIEPEVALATRGIIEAAVVAVRDVRVALKGPSASCRA